MTRRWLLLVALALLTALAGLPANASAAPPAAERADAFAEVAGCIAAADNVLVSVVVDESLSLRETDPEGLRVGGITAVLDALELLSSSAGPSTRVDVRLSSFARGYRHLTDWQRLTPTSAETLRATAARELPGRDEGDATDYRQALRGAQADLARRQQSLQDPHACKVMLWFTDGALDVDAETSTAERELCQSGGIVDSVRADGVAVIALALFTPGGGVSVQQREQLRSVAEGRGGDAAVCGTVPIPSASSSGVYLPADDPAALQRLFAGAGALVSGGTEVDVVTCPGPGCRNGAYTFDIDRGIAGARLLVQRSSTAGQAMQLQGPAGQQVDVSRDGSVEVEGAVIDTLVRGHLATVNISFDPYATGRSRWTLRPGAQSQVSAYWFWGARLELETDEIQAGEVNEIRMRLLDQKGDPLAVDLFREVLAEVSVGGRQLRPTITPDGQITARFDLGVDDVPAALPVNAFLRATSAPGDVALGPISVEDRLTVALPPA